MAWLAVDGISGQEIIFEEKPTRHQSKLCWGYRYADNYNPEVSLPEGSIKKLIGRTLTWDDEPFELKDEE